MVYKFFAVDAEGLATGATTLDSAIYEARSVAGLEPNLYGEVMACRVVAATDDGQPDYEITIAEFAPVTEAR